MPQSYFTKETEVTNKIQIHAVTRTEHEREIARKEGDDNPFRYVLCDMHPYNDQRVKVAEFDVTLTVPEGIDLLSKAVETLRARKDSVMEVAKIEGEKLDKQIQGLLMLEAPVQESVVEAHWNGMNSTFDDIPF